MKTLKLLSIIVLFLSLTSCKFFKQQKWFSKDVDTLLFSTEETTDTNFTDTTAIETIVQETEPIAAPTSQPVSGYGSDKYYMVVGSFLSEQLANTYAKKMQEKGYQSQIIYSSSQGYYRVSAKSYSDYTTAVNDISNFRDNVTPRAWVHVKRN